MTLDPAKPAPEGAAAAQGGDGLTMLERLVILGVAVVIFTFATGPIWRHPYDINAAVFWSYLAIPLMVAGALLALRRWSLKAAVLESALLLTTKFGITYVFSAVLWSVAGPPPTAARMPLPVEPPRAAAAPAIPTVFAPGDLEEIDGRVVDARGAPVPDALVYVWVGLEGLVFKPPEVPAILTNDGAGFKPALSAVMAGQPIIARTTDSRLHTVRVYGGDAVLLNVPAISRQSEHRFAFDEAHGETRVVCGVHEALGSEVPARLLVLGHPFFALTDAQGNFRLAGIPRRAVELRTYGPGGCVGTRGVTPASGGPLQTELSCLGSSDGG